MHNNQWGYGNFSPHARSYEHNSYDYYEGSRLGARNCYHDTPRKRVPRNEIRNERNYVNGRFHKRRDDYEVWEQKMESLFYSHCVREEEKFQLVLKSLSYEKENEISTNQDLELNVNHEGQRQGQAKEKFMKSSMSEKSTKVDEISSRCT
ncbi:hypothetical protein M9H77_11699 [Catharanthus roseus]|uniref:Uncharacterized protein n=1 Tax=Catharanthus roseus TaxID=4058 RepID=A0ACC0BFD1_CATRO|nr:hypothetical protein M9H77_11699 [Catharanthus roseus]